MKSMKSRSAARHWLIDGLVLSALVMVTSFAMACRHAAFTTVEIKIVYEDIGFSEQCPTSTLSTVMPPTVERGDKIVWQSVDGDNGNIPVGKSYRILFNPFVGKSLWWGNSIKSNKRSGEAKSRPVHKTTPDLDENQPGEWVEFKYTVVSLDDPMRTTDCPPLDPRLRVGR
jgi:hypothetical protein